VGIVPQPIAKLPVDRGRAVDDAMQVRHRDGGHPDHSIRRSIVEVGDPRTLNKAGAKDNAAHRPLVLVHRVGRENRVWVPIEHADGIVTVEERHAHPVVAAVSLGLVALIGVVQHKPALRRLDGWRPRPETFALLGAGPRLQHRNRRGPGPQVG